MLALAPMGQLEPSSGKIDFTKGEIEVGKWIDGKTIYKSVIDSTVGELQNDLNAIGIDYVVDMYGMALSNYGNWFPIPCKNIASIDYNDADHYTISILQSNLSARNFQITFGDYYATTNKAYIVVEYTKKGV